MNLRRKYVNVVTARTYCNSNCCSNFGGPFSCRSAFRLCYVGEVMLFLAEVANATQWILPAVLLVLVIGIFILNYFRSKKNQESMKNMVDGLKVGDNVKTYSGLYGKILEIVETTDGKVAVLETGSEKNKGIFSIDINAIYGIDEKKPVVYDADGNIIDEDAKVDKKSKNKTEKDSKVVAEKVEEKTETLNEKPKRKSKKQPVEEAKPEEKIKESKTEQPTVEEKVDVQPALEISEEKEELSTKKKATKKSK